MYIFVFSPFRRIDLCLHIHSSFSLESRSLALCRSIFPPSLYLLIHCLFCQPRVARPPVLGKGKRPKDCCFHRASQSFPFKSRSAGRINSGRGDNQSLPSFRFIAAGSDRRSPLSNRRIALIGNWRPENSPRLQQGQ